MSIFSLHFSHFLHIQRIPSLSLFCLSPSHSLSISLFICCSVTFFYKFFYILPIYLFYPALLSVCIDASYSPHFLHFCFCFNSLTPTNTHTHTSANTRPDLVAHTVKRLLQLREAPGSIPRHTKVDQIGSGIAPLLTIKHI